MTPQEKTDLRRVLDFFEGVYDLIEISHGKCDLTSDETCRAEEYGDGEACQHQLLRDCQGINVATLRGALTR